LCTPDMNLADISTLFTLLGCPIAAALSAGPYKAGWLIVIFVVFGLAVGIAGSYVVRRLACSILFASCKVKTAWAGVPLFRAYMVVPLAGTFGFISLTVGGTVWVMKHVSPQV
jgi:hypothetical protein